MNLLSKLQEICYNLFGPADIISLISGCVSIVLLLIVGLALCSLLERPKAIKRRVYRRYRRIITTADNDATKYSAEQMKKDMDFAVMPILSRAMETIYNSVERSNNPDFITAAKGIFGSVDLASWTSISWYCERMLLLINKFGSARILSLMTPQDIVALNSYYKAFLRCVSALRECEKTCLTRKMRNMQSNTIEYQTVCKQILDGGISVRDCLVQVHTETERLLKNVEVRAVPIDIKPKSRRKTCIAIMESVTAAAEACRSKKVRVQFSALQKEITAYKQLKTNKRETDRRINTYYLPTLEMVLNALAQAERKKSKQVKELESLCLRTIGDITDILAARDAEYDKLVVRNMQVEVTSMKEFAMLKGDLPVSCL